MVPRDDLSLPALFSLTSLPATKNVSCVSHIKHAQKEKIKLVHQPLLWAMQRATLLMMFNFSTLFALFTCAWFLACLGCVPSSSQVLASTAVPAA
jgi:hypothetical protein